MIQILLSIAMAQPLPNEISASRTCSAISEFYQREEQEINKKNAAMQKDCEETTRRLPKRLQKNVQCLQFYAGSMYSFVNTQRFHNECEKILSKMNVREHLYGPLRSEDYDRNPVQPDWGI